MSVRQDRGAWEVRWRDGSGRRRAKRFDDEQAARAFDEALGEVAPIERRSDTATYGAKGGVYSYDTAQGTRWRYVFRRTDGTQTSKRGFSSQAAARTALRRLTEQMDRGEVRHTTQTFGSWWETWLQRRKPYLEPNAWRAYDVDGRKRLLPAFRDVRLDKLEIENVRAWMQEQGERVEAQEVAAKTINNTLGTLVVCLNAAVKDRVTASNPAIGIERLPPAHIEHDYLRLQEIPAYLDACLSVYRPLAEVLVRAGLRISEAIALQIADVELEATGGFIVVYRSHKKARTRKTTNGSTKGDRFRSVEIGPGLSRTLQEQLARRAEMASGDQKSSPVFVMPLRTRKADRGRWSSAGDPEPFDRNTVSQDWHKVGLQDAALRDMPLHALRHTAAAAWLAGGNSLMYVQRQLGHADIGTTERYYGHLERHVLAAGAIATEEVIARAVAANR
ncbi:MAG: tyrosine-type recombinase/integrase [Solirubrobacterales bacterium]|nr:tyrosine-type recombinase/integrase [Solirubrobacterales bacterium]